MAFNILGLSSRSAQPDVLDGLDTQADLAERSLPHRRSPKSLPLEIRPEGELEPQSPIAPTASGASSPRSPQLPGVRASQRCRIGLCTRLRETSFLEHTNPLFMHGRGYCGPMRAPVKTWECDNQPLGDRSSSSASSWLTASEFEDMPVVAAAKARQLTALLRLSRKTVVYTGTGISAEVVAEAMLSGTERSACSSEVQLANPTFTHYALTFMFEMGLVHSWVHQGYDGLPQKAGFPQEYINEIYGSLYDPSNPVVKSSGSLHPGARRWMEDDAETADLVLVLGTTLQGLPADQVATLAANRSLLPPGLLPGIGGGLGTVYIGLQQTEQDGMMTLRLFGKSDDILSTVFQELRFNSTFKPLPPVWPKENRVLVPYDAYGRRLSAGGGKWMWLDLRDGQKVRITPGHNIQGAQHPQYMHIGADNSVVHQGITRQPREGFGKVVRRNAALSCFILQVEGVEMCLGIWWLEAAVKGSVEVLPVVNQVPAFDGRCNRIEHKLGTAASIARLYTVRLLSGLLSCPFNACGRLRRSWLWLRALVMKRLSERAGKLT